MALRRRDEILKVIRGAAVHSQEELQHRLARRGIDVAQPTLSRDLKDLQKADLHMTSMEGAWFNGVNLSRANLSYSRTTFTHYGGGDFATSSVPAQPENVLFSRDFDIPTTA